MQQDFRDWQKRLHVWRIAHREALAEFYGTFLLVLMGTGLSAQVILSDQNQGDSFSASFGWGLAVAISIYTAGGVSNAHLNPAVTVVFAAFKFGDFPWRKVPIFIAAQFAGAFCGAALMFGNYHESFDDFDKVRTNLCLASRLEQRHNVSRVVYGDFATAQAFATYPAPFLSTFGGLLDEIVSTALLVSLIFALSDDRNRAKPKSNINALLMGFGVALLNMGFGLQTLCAMNPARDFGPRLFSALFWGGSVFTVRNCYFWIPLFAPIFGGLLGGVAYFFFVCHDEHHPDDRRDSLSINEAQDQQSPSSPLLPDGQRGSSENYALPTNTGVGSKTAASAGGASSLRSATHSGAR